MFFKEILVFVAMAAFFHTNPLFGHDRISKSLQVLKVTCQNDIAALVNLDATVIDPEDAVYYNHQLQQLIREIGGKCETIIIRAQILRIEMFKPTLFSIFLKAVADENGIREYEKLEPFTVFLYIPFQFCYHDLVNYIGNDGIVYGVIFQASLIQVPVSTWGFDKMEILEVCLNVEKFKNILNSLRLMFGYELKMGLAVNSYEEYMDSLEREGDKVISSFDMVIFNESLMDYRGAVKDTNEMDLYFRNCVQLFQDEYEGFSFYFAENDFNFNN